MKCKYRHEEKKCETWGIKYKHCGCFLVYTIFKDDLIQYKCFCSNKNYQQKFEEKLKERFFNTYKFSSYDNDKFILLLQKGIYFINIWMIGKDSMKHHRLNSKIFEVT